MDRTGSAFGIDIRWDDAVDRIVKKTIGKIDSHGVMMPGVLRYLNFTKGTFIGSTSSPMSLVTVVDKLGIRPYLHTATSAEIFRMANLTQYT